MPLIYNGTTVEKVIYNGTEVDKVVYNDVTVFESKPQLATPQNVTADGTVVSWDEVENATSYEVYADGASIGTVTDGYTLTVRNNTNGVDVRYKIDGTATPDDYDGILTYALVGNETTLKNIKSFVSFDVNTNRGIGAPVSMVNCTFEKVSSYRGTLTLSGNASCVLNPTD